MYEIKVSNRKNKKYMVKVGNKWVHFGDRRYQHYRDSTPLKAFSKLDHGDDKRRELYYKRHGKAKPLSAKYFSHKYLW
jgi:hypothetical protein